MAERLVGLVPGEDQYIQLCYPHDSPDSARTMSKRQSACALVAGGYLLCLGLRSHRLSGPYFGKTNAVSRLVQIGADHDALSRYSLPDMGDIAIIGSGLGTHALVSLGDYREGGEEFLLSVDGGRGPIREARRRIVYTDSGKPALRDQALGTRVIEYRINISKLPLSFELVYPRP